MDDRHVVRISLSRLKRLKQYFSDPHCDIELTPPPFCPKPLSMRLISSFDQSDEEWYIMGYAWDQVPDSLLFRIQVYASERDVMLDCRCLYDMEKLFPRWLAWIKTSSFV